MRVLILDANQRSALAVTRSLGKHNIEVVTADETRSTLSGSSKYSIAEVAYPSPTTNTDAFINSVEKIAAHHNIKMLLPMTELTTELLSIYKNRLSGYLLPFSNIDIINTLADKCLLIETAEKLGLNTPASTVFRDAISAVNKSADFEYPVVLKPGKSWQNNGSSWFRAAVRIARSPDQARNFLTSDPAFMHQPFLVQQHISGHGAGIFAIYNHGAPIAFFSHKRLREKPPAGGVSVLSESTPMDELLLADARKLLDHVKWHGVAMVEFKVDKDGTPYLMEVNTRFWGSLQLAIDAGVDFPWLLYQIANGQSPNPVNHYNTGQRLRWLLGDLDNLYLTLKDPDYPLATKLKSVLHFFSPTAAPLRYEINRFGDLRPAWFELKKYIKDTFSH